MMWCWRAVQMATSVRPRRPRHPPPLRSAWLVDIDCGATISVRGDGIGRAARGRRRRLPCTMCRRVPFAPCLRKAAAGDGRGERAVIQHFR